MFSITFREYTLMCMPEGLPDMYDEYVRHATLIEQIGLRTGEGELCFMAVRKGTDWPFLVVAQRYNPWGMGFHPGALVVPESDRLFIGAGTRLLGYRLDTPERLWEDKARNGFWSWQVHEQTAVMAAEKEIAAWDLSGKKRWSVPLDTPWNYTVSNGTVNVDVAGRPMSFSLLDGPE